MEVLDDSECRWAIPDRIYIQHVGWVATGTTNESGVVRTTWVTEPAVTIGDGLTTDENRGR